MKVFITGYKGFVGRHLTPRLSSWKGYRGDILDKKKLTRAMKGCDAVIHLAGKFNGPDSNLIYTTNLVGTANVVQAMHENGIKKLIYTSSVGAGDRFYNAYDDSKYICEKIVLDKSLDTTVLRLSNLYGKDQKDKVITYLINGFKGGLVKITGDGTQTRDFIHVDDVIDSIILALNAPGDIKPIEIGRGRSYSILEAVKLLSELTGIKPKIKFTKLPKYAKNMQYSKVNLYRAKKYLNFQPTYNLKEGLEDIL